eukprot:m.332324 g.332324  ORF g.332324 m.332324 type:complete len:1330 (-) comp19776_c1_seq9:60-4049(-)
MPSAGQVAKGLVADGGKLFQGKFQGSIQVDAVHREAAEHGVQPLGKHARSTRVLIAVTAVGITLVDKSKGDIVQTVAADQLKWQSCTLPESANRLLLIARLKAPSRSHRDMLYLYVVDLKSAVQGVWDAIEEQTGIYPEIPRRGSLPPSNFNFAQPSQNQRPAVPTRRNSPGGGSMASSPPHHTGFPVLAHSVSQSLLSQPVPSSVLEAQRAQSRHMSPLILIPQAATPSDGRAVPGAAKPRLRSDPSIKHRQNNTQHPRPRGSRTSVDGAGRRPSAEGRPGAGGSSRVGSVHAPPMRRDSGSSSSLTKMAESSTGDRTSVLLKNFTCLYLGGVNVPQPSGERIVRSAIEKCNDIRHRNSTMHEKALRRRQSVKNVAQELKEEPVSLEITNESVRAVDPHYENTVFQEPIVNVCFISVQDGERGKELLAFITFNKTLDSIVCHVFEFGRGQAHQASDALDKAQKEHARRVREQGTDPFAVMDHKRSTVHKTLINKQIRRGHLEALEVLGAGQFGEVHLANQIVKNKSGASEKRKRAVKLLRSNAAEKDRDSFLAEVLVMCKLQHKHLVRMIGVAVQQKPWLAVLEFMEYGDLRSVLKACKQKKIDLTYSEQLSWSAQVASGCAFISEQRLVHMDLAARNVLLGKGNNVKVSDFGLTRPMDEDKDYFVLREFLRLPLKWIAPEALKAKRFSEATDVWAVGILMWEIASYGDTPYKFVKTADISRKVQQGLRLEKPLGCPPMWYGMMTRCWEAEPTKRWKFIELKAFVLKELNRVGSSVRDIGHTLKETPMPQDRSKMKLSTVQGLSCPICQKNLKELGHDIMAHVELCESKSGLGLSAPKARTPYEYQYRESVIVEEDEEEENDDGANDNASQVPSVPTTAKPTANKQPAPSHDDGGVYQNLPEEFGFDRLSSVTAALTLKRPKKVNKKKEEKLAKKKSEEIYQNVSELLAQQRKHKLEEYEKAKQEGQQKLQQAETVAEQAAKPAESRAAVLRRQEKLAAERRARASMYLSNEEVREHQRAAAEEAQKELVTELLDLDSGTEPAQQQPKRSKIYEALNPQPIAFQSARERAQLEEQSEDVGVVGLKDYSVLLSARDHQLGSVAEEEDEEGDEEEEEEKENEASGDGEVFGFGSAAASRVTSTIKSGEFGFGDMDQGGGAADDDIKEEEEQDDGSDDEDDFGFDPTARRSSEPRRPRVSTDDVELQAAEDDDDLEAEFGQVDQPAGDEDRDLEDDVFDEDDQLWDLGEFAEEFMKMREARAEEEEARREQLRLEHEARKRAEQEALEKELAEIAVRQAAEAKANEITDEDVRETQRRLENELVFNFTFSF